MVDQLDYDLVIPVDDLAAIVDWAAGGLMELTQLDPSQAHVMGTFLALIDRGAFADRGAGTTPAAGGP